MRSLDVECRDLASCEAEVPRLSTFEISDKFREEIRSYGLEPPEGIEPGKWHRFPGFGKGPTNRSAWCRLFPDEQGGAFGDWSSGLNEVWLTRRKTWQTKSEREAFRQQIKASKELAEAKRNRNYANSAKKAEAVWEHLAPAPSDHPYLIRKRIQPHGARIYENQLVLPVGDFTDRLTSLQFISPNGNKQLLKGGRKQGCYIPVAGDPDNHSRIIICEGWATGCSLAEDETSALVIAAIDAGNLAPVAVAARDVRPNAEIVIAGDDDRKTPGNRSIRLTQTYP